MTIVLAIILGALFGGALYYVGASSPKNISEMLRLENLSLMKIIIFAIGLSSVILSIFSTLGWFNLSHLSIKTTNLGVIIGGIIFGFGFGSIGTCPGTCVAASGVNGVKKAVSVIIGGLFGAWLFSMSYGFLEKLHLFDIFDLGKLTLFSISDRYPSIFPIGYRGLLIVGVLFMLIGYLLPNNISSKNNINRL